MKAKNYQWLLKMPLVLLLFLGISFNSTGQTCTSPPDCLENPDLTATTGGNLNPGSTITVPGWYRSHGTPTVGIGNGYGGANSIWMWSYSGTGEGIYSCFNFKKYRTYRLCFWVRNTNGVTGGNLFVKAATGLTQTSFTTIPTPTTSQTISSSYTYSAGWTQMTLTYTPNADYNQLWIYPFWATDPQGGPQYELRVSKVNVFEVPPLQSYLVPCEGTLNLNGSPLECVRTDWYDPNSDYIGSGDISIRNMVSANTGTYTMVLTSGDCSVSFPIDVTVKCNCDDVVVDFNAETSTQPVQFTETSTGSGTAVGWYWDFGDGQTSNDQNPSHTFAQGGTYNVCLTIIRRVGDQTCCVRYCKDVQVGIPPPGTLVAPDFGAALLDYPRNAIQFTNNTATQSPIKEYSWDFGDGQTSGQPDPAHVYRTAGTYQVCLRVTENIYDEEGNLKDQEVNKYCHTVEVAGDKAAEIKAGSASVMPNPVTNEAMVTIENLPNAKVSLHNVAGEQVATGKLVEKDHYLLQMSQLPSGMYIIEVKSEGVVRTLKLIKE